MKRKLVLIIFLILLTGGEIISQEELVTVAVLDFDNNSGIKEWDKLCAGIPQILITDLSSNKNIKIVDRKKIEAALQEFKLTSSGLISGDKAQEMGKFLGAELLVSGGVIKIGNNIRIDAHIFKVKTSETIGTKIVGKSEDEIIDMIDQLAQKIGAVIEGPDRLAKEKAEKEAEVAKLIAEGISLFNMEKYEEAISKWKEALSIDPYNDTALKHIESAKLKIEARDAARKQAEERAKAEREKINKIQNTLAIASTLYNQGHYDEAVAKWQEVLAIDPENQEAKMRIEEAKTKSEELKLRLEAAEKAKREAEERLKREAEEKAKAEMEQKLRTEQAMKEREEVKKIVEPKKKSPTWLFFTGTVITGAFAGGAFAVFNNKYDNYKKMEPGFPEEEYDDAISEAEMWGNIAIGSAVVSGGFLVATIISFIKNKTSKQTAYNNFLEIMGKYQLTYDKNNIVFRIKF